LTSADPAAGPVASEWSTTGGVSAAGHDGLT
jgi:hypothetical protein